jgi:esterase/lipase
MQFFSGFQLKNEKSYFSDFLKESEFTVAGFSYGAIKALNYVLENEKRVDRLQLFSPAFFQNKNEKFIRLQLISFRKNPELYSKNFFKNIFYPSQTQEIEKVNGTIEELEELLTFKWNDEVLQNVKNRGIEIEVFLGGKDKIIDSKEAHEFFKQFGKVCFMKNRGHFLRSI